jgi:transcriptional repressor NrdR
VLDSRSSGGGIRRRRQCQDCGARFTTHERVERKVVLVVKKDGSRESFHLDKVRAGLQLALRKRPVSALSIETGAQAVEAAVLAQPGGEVEADFIGRAVMQELSKLDPVAYVRFASVYMDVDSPQEFIDLIKDLAHDRGAE